MFEGYLSLGGGEVLNSARSVGYTTTAPCPVKWLVCPPCDGIRDVLGHEQYHYGNIADAPWYDAEDEPTHRFLGAHGISFEGIPDSTREANVAEGVLDGGVVGKLRHGTRRVRVRAMLTAIGEDALEVGFSWLDSALRPGVCGTHGDACGAADARFYAACPPEQADVTSPGVVWNDSVTNLATNPSMEAAGAATAVRTNLATNPSFEATTAATVEFARNLHLNPQGLSSIKWSYNSGTATRATVATGGPSGGSWEKFVYSVAPSTSTDIYTTSIGTNTVPVTPGLPYTFSGYVISDHADLAHVQVNIIWRDAAGISLGGDNSSQPELTSPGVWERRSKTVTPPANTARAEVKFNFSGGMATMPVGAYMGVANAMVEQSSALGAYFDGSTLPAGDFLHAWTGTVNASPSVQYGTLTVTPLTSAAWNNDNSSFNIQSTEWVASGARSARSIPRNSGAYQYLNLTNHGTFTVGKTYTVMATMRMKEAQTHATPKPEARSLIYKEGSTILAQAQAPNAPGVYPLRITFTYNNGAPSLLLFYGQAYNSGNVADSKDVWWDDLLIVEGTYTGPYFDGSTPAKVRRNLTPNPSFDVNVTTGWTAFYSPTRTLDTTDYHSAPSSVRLGKGTGVAQGIHTNGVGAVSTKNAKPGDVLHASAWIKAPTGIPFRFTFKQDAGSTGTHPDSIVGDGTWHQYDITYTLPDKFAASGYQVMIISDNSALGGIANGDPFLWVDDVLFEVNTTGEYFDGAHPVAPYVAAWEGTADASASYLTDPDFTYAWSGTANASVSSQRGTTVASYVGGAAAAIQSKQWAKDRAASMRHIPMYPSRGSAYIDVASIAAPRGLEPGKTYTASIMLRMPTLYGSLPGLVQTGTTGGYNVTTTAVATVGEQHMHLTFTVPPTGNWYLRLYHNGTFGEPDIWWDALTIVEGVFSEPYFDGAMPDSPPEDLEIIDKIVHEYEWTGAADASSSTHRTGNVFTMPDPVAYDKIVDRMVRNLHTVTCVSGPTVVDKYHRDNTWGYQVEFVLVAAVPWMFGDTKPINLEPSVPVVIQDVPFNLVPYPSAELALGTVVAATNFSTNPSIEVDITGWSVESDGVKIPGAQVVIARTNELFSDGGWAARALFTAAASNSAGYFGAGQTVELPGLAANTRVSLNLWAAASIESGTAVLGTLNAYVYWQNAAGATLRTDGFGSLPASGGAFSTRSMLPPAGTTKARVHARINLTSWSAGAKVRMYADSLAVSVP